MSPRCAKPLQHHQMLSSTALLGRLIVTGGRLHRTGMITNGRCPIVMINAMQRDDPFAGPVASGRAFGALHTINTPAER